MEVQSAEISQRQPSKNCIEDKDIDVRLMRLKSSLPTSHSCHVALPNHLTTKIPHLHLGANVEIPDAFKEAIRVLEAIAAI